MLLLFALLVGAAGAFTVGWRAPVVPSATAKGPLSLGPAQVPESLKEQLERQFNSTMQCRTVPPLRDFETYYASMPVRMHLGEPMRLCEHPFWTDERDVEFMSECLSRKATDRNWVFYLAAPSKSGKTSCGVPVFLQGAKAGNFTHYLYCAFDNNKGRNFRLDPPDPSANLNTAEKQGAAFALDFIKVLFETPGDFDAYEIPRNDDPPRAVTTQTRLDAYLENMLPSDAKVVVHLDEHREICEREGVSAVSGARFAKGAIEALQSSKMVTVFATHVSRPPVKDAKTGRGLCRKAVPRPAVDVAQVMAATPELRFPKEKLEREHRFAWTFLKCRLGAKIVQSNLANMHKPDPETQLFLDNFEKAAAIPNYAS